MFPGFDTVRRLLEESQAQQSEQQAKAGEPMGLAAQPKQHLETTEIEFQTPAELTSKDLHLQIEGNI